MWTVYAIVNKECKIYVGMTSNIQRRIAQHNGNRSNWTKFKGHWRLVYLKEFTDSKIARSHEKYLKGGKGRKLVKESIARVAELADAQS
ncbi:MAG: GIY-YIG nuclease family protein [Candidatus Roizmanbacteria bacterium]|nr:GIY-YIG nuclease family protein [Candidatus Roizmanbacteria bacterium]